MSQSIAITWLRLGFFLRRRISCVIYISRHAIRRCIITHILSKSIPDYFEKSSNQSRSRFKGSAKWKILIFIFLEIIFRNNLKWISKLSLNYMAKNIMWQKQPASPPANTRTRFRTIFLFSPPPMNIQFANRNMVCSSKIGLTQF